MCVCMGATNVCGRVFTYIRELCIFFCGSHNEGTGCEQSVSCSVELQLHEANGLIPVLKKAKYVY
jgi:hypothetical protein